MQNNPLQDDLTGDLAAAVRRSWSESQNTARRQGGGPSYTADPGHSPIGTPVPEPFEDVSIHKFNSTYPQSNSSSLSESGNAPHFKQPKLPLQQQNQPIIINEATGHHAFDQFYHNHHTNGNNNTKDNKNGKEPDYQLFKHHYSISEDHRDSVVEILNGLELESPEPETMQHSASPRLPEQHPIHGTIPREHRTSVSKQSTTTRRGSMQDVQWVRQLLNPRSSFSGRSVNEPPANGNSTASNSVKNNNTGSCSGSVSYDFPTDNKCWVTILADDSIEAVKSVVVLSESVRLSGSIYPLYVVHDNQINMSRLNNYNVASIPISLEHFIKTSNESPHNNWLILSLFINLVDHFDVVCYISPTCMLVDNIDEILTSDAVCDEIDNETCVLLTNDVIDNKEEPQLMILKPNQEVSMCIKEYFTMYGDGNDNKLERLQTMNDFDVLKELFHDTWGHISSNGYVSVLHEDIYLATANQSFSKITDFKYLQPWNNKITKDNGDSTLCGRWRKLWTDFCQNVT
ncbi:similar to Saccharomyces cerevisiae YJL146W IDS2 Protein involved in modulation of Ime2p activity during meiosis, appears to act indirectly to promote Ime2p-mediated late meiotic functions [Maudiozyma barnettii]|uniref:Similar to Saccharomyces cerevisiae YJL146W IDS2 Protein involved in modulation of Ime2p activity during meiosis, appears to act indirectly to promote Ime2p-mediated late meiotic functions n=1 Tax=Maudiozyma barnettii TaxID=61262 RepID=A0A8H2VGG7_9SACH|nr:Ids2p [Kazachstania barnettii]CAB4255125.1 similar to Saccharomyces cerevisiae YJL146W IDS2 Protein involved in modulation of Ime2p activity during meiosis, appears to act indirectly to promote Ime2p-mediated late meiotic functions [Kazachstania barnettii]CAD1783396.1 similar to Saccharomyces cerevisiae YJL146W IDS2 Protein involved in modulation of Ime2p activity during meiosis, appears to act indirectly to promote Ime2p-mediated late meiotic functions [Kazachstania barnettii]